MAVASKQVHQHLTNSQQEIRKPAGLGFAEIEKACRQAERCLYDALRLGNQPQLIDKAMGIYQSLMQAEPRLADPYLGVAYLAYSAGRGSDALAVLGIPVSLGVVDIRLDQMIHRIRQLQKRAPAQSEPQRIQRLATSLRADRKACSQAMAIESDEDEELFAPESFQMLEI